MHSSLPSPYQDTLRTVRESLETTSGLPVSSQTGAQVPKSQAMAVIYTDQPYQAVGLGLGHTYHAPMSPQGQSGVSWLDTAKVM